MKVSNEMERYLKKSIITVFVMLIIALIPNITKATTTEDDFEYETYKDWDGTTTVTITKYTGSATTLSIPSKINGYPVTSIGNAFENCTNLVEITIPNSVTSIGYGDFEGCKNLTKITISATSIKDCAFDGCESLTEIIITNSVTNINYDAFNGCKSLKQIKVSEDSQYYCDIDGILFNKDISKLLAYPCKKENSTYIIPNSVTIIGNSSFDNCENLTGITIPNSVTNIEGYSLFDGCKSLKQIKVSEDNQYYCDIDGVLFTKDISKLLAYPCKKEDITYMIPNSVTVIGDSAFKNCINLVEITIPNSVTCIEYSAFENCTSLKEIIIPGSIEILTSRIFENCKSLTKVTIQDGVEVIINGAFANCTNLQEVILPKSVTDFVGSGDPSFIGCTNLTLKVYNNSNSLQYAKDNKIPYEIIDEDNNKDDNKPNPTPAPTKIDISSVVVSNITSQKYTGSEIKPAITVTYGNTILKDGTDYTVSYTNNTNIGTATITITGIGDYTGTKTATFEIVKKDENNNSATKIDISKATVTNISNKVYIYADFKPSVTVKIGNITLKLNTDYTVSYLNNRNTGRATVIITGIGDYTGTKTKYFYIVPNKVTGLKAKRQDTKSITLNWSKTIGATGYTVQKYDTSKKKWVNVKTTKNNSLKITGLKAGTTYKFKVRAYKTVSNKKYYGVISSTLTTGTKTKTPTARVKAGKKKATISWKKVSGATGYQVQMSTKKNRGYKTIKTTKGKTVSYTKTKLKKGKRYYFKVRTYKTINGKKIYSSYSKIVSVKIR